MSFRNIIQIQQKDRSLILIMGLSKVARRYRLKLKKMPITDVVNVYSDMSLSKGHLESRGGGGGGGEASKIN